MRRAYYIFFALLLVIAGGAASLFLIPSGKEIALINYKDKQYDEALALYEEQFRSGNIDIEIAMHLASVYLQYSEIDKAISVMETYVEKNPNNLQARKELGSLYQYGQRLDDYTRNLEEITRIEQSSDNLQMLSNMYRFNEDYDKYVPTMVELVEKDAAETPTDMKDLARMLAGNKDYAKSIEILKKLRTEQPQNFTFSEQELLVRLLVDNNNANEAHLEALAYREKPEATLEQIAQLTNIINFQIDPEKAYEFVKPFIPKVTQNATLLEEYVLVLINIGQRDEAFALLKPLYDNKTLPAPLYRTLLMLAASQGEYDLAMQIANEIGVQSLAEDEALELIEIALVNKLPQLVDLIYDANKDKPLNDKPRLAAALALAKGQTAEADTILGQLHFHELILPQRLQLARICHYTDNSPCLRTFFGSLPEPSTVTERELVAISELQLARKRFQDGMDYLTKSGKDLNTAELSPLTVRFAAGTGDHDRVKEWLAANPEASNQTLLAELYFTSMSAQQYDLASDLAERILKIENTPTTRSYVVQAYLKNGQLDMAMPLLREDRTRSKQDMDNYLFALTKLAKNSSEYRNELGDYARATLANASYKERLALIYALIDSGQAGIAMPYVRNLALNEGGDWVSLYTEQTRKSGNTDELVAFWKELAAQPGVSQETLNQISYNLLEHGEKQQAMELFETLAADAPANSDAVNQLLYLWGPVYDNQQLAWIGERARTAPNDAEREAWYRHMVNGSSTDDLMRYVQQSPEALNSPVIEEQYIAALNMTGNTEYLRTLLNYRIESVESTEALESYANYAQSFSQNDLAAKAYGRVLEAKPQEPNALLNLGINAFTKADYSRSKFYLKEYIDLVEANKAAPTNDSYTAYYYYAQTLKRDNADMNLQQHYFKKAAELSQLAPQDDLEMLSTRAASLAYSGNPQAGYALFEESIAAHPENRLLRANYVTLLTEMKQYDKASAYITSAPSAEATLVSSNEALTSILINNPAIRGYELRDYNQQLVVFFTPAAGERSWLSAADLKPYPWLSYASEGYDRGVLVSAPGYQMSVAPNGAGSLLITALPIINADALIVQEELNQRYVLMDSRIKLATGDEQTATKNMNTLLTQYPNDPEIIGFTANAENAIGNWPRALALLEEANALSPENEDIQFLMRDIERFHGQNVFADAEWRSLGDNDEYIYTIGASYLLNNQWEVGLILQHDDIDSATIRRANGDIGTYEDERQNGEFYVRHFFEDGSALMGSLYANNDTPGAGVRYNWSNPLGFTGIAAEYHRSYWEFVEGVLDDATRDRVEVSHIARLDHNITVSGEAALNNYNVESADDVSQTVSVGGQVIYPLIDDRHYLAVGYGLDGEYIIDDEKRTDATGASFRQLPLISREVHSLNLLGTYYFSRDTIADGVVGFGVDRLGGHGPQAEGRLTHYLTDDLSVQARASYGLREQDTTDDVTRAGVRLQYNY